MPDHNELPASVGFPSLPSLTRLWLNHNRIDNAAVFVESLAAKFPRLKHVQMHAFWAQPRRELSLLGNAGNPSYFSGGSKDQYTDFR